MICGPLLGGAFLAQLVARELHLPFCFTDRIQSEAGVGMYHTRYRLPSAFNARVRGQRVAIVDDVMSAGSALRGTFIALHSQGAITVAAGSLLQLGDAGSSYFESKQIPVVAVARDNYELWLPESCPLCAQAVPLESAGSSL
jgi:orotate phosphoribosyltransferase